MCMRPCVNSYKFIIYTTFNRVILKINMNTKLIFTLSMLYIDGATIQDIFFNLDNPNTRWHHQITFINYLWRLSYKRIQRI